MGQEIAGPAIVESLDSTLVIPPAWQGAVDAAGFIRPNPALSGKGVENDRSKTGSATFEVVKNSLLKIAEEMKIVLAKTAYSPILKVAGDYSCGVFDIQGNMVAQGPDLPIHLGSMPDAVRAVSRFLATMWPMAMSLSTTTLISAARICRM